MVCYSLPEVQSIFERNDDQGRIQDFGKGGLCLCPDPRDPPGSASDDDVYVREY